MEKKNRSILYDKEASGHMKNEHSFHSIIPPYMLKELSQSNDASVRDMAFDTTALSESLRAVRITLHELPIMAAIPSPNMNKNRLIYTLNNKTRPLPGTPKREENSSPTGDEAIDEAYDYSGDTYDFYRQILNRNSLDDKGESLISTVHYGIRYTNAFWNGEQMVYGDGDGKFFNRFTKSLDVIGHELTHGVIAHTCNLEYEHESGALNEHFADVMGILIKQCKNNLDVNKSDWLIGKEIMMPGTIKAIRTFKNEKAYTNDPNFGTDPQPKHMKDFYKGDDDNGGVHYNSGIPNCAFYHAAMDIGGNAWDVLGKIWYKTLLNLNRYSNFIDAAKMTIMVAKEMYDAGSKEEASIRKAWKTVGVL